MATDFKKTYKFAGYTSSYITTFLTLVMGVFFYYNQTISYWYLLAFAIICYLICFFIIQSRVENFIYKRIQKIYDDLTLLEATSFSKQQITTDMETLTKEVERFAQNKKLEIESLKGQEMYRKEFLGNVSHELKTPLFTVQGYIETLLDGAMNDKAVRKNYLQRAGKGVDRLIHIIKDLDMISKLEAGNLAIEPKRFNIIELVQNTMDQLEMKAEKKNIQLTFDIIYKDSIFVKADPERIQQVLLNLMVNSIKYGKYGGTTEVSIEDLIKNKVIIRVTDNGEGIQKENIQRLFERFYRVDKTGSRKEGGSGLGLSIVKHIMDAHGEKIYVESQIGIGSEFSFTLEKAK
ncbi:sensor histidine kinase [Ulvibacter antarcticus]|uniref:histidine kinase n=1 Tax=Ulvibacter antarcticus TaxID=442714 RepID=A0A3L9Z7U5_9FLAO|nr:ATP-binding protein [Ulvibacter antarcticus]RMA66355.1 two-component system phosphate regulon sensor histidine kinase PhoR [Ulvibacter antarcticus]